MPRVDRDGGLADRRRYYMERIPGKSTDARLGNDSLTAGTSLFRVAVVIAKTFPSVIGIGLIGLGRHGARYARHILHDVKAARLAAGCRRRPERGLGLPGAEAVPVYADVAALIADPAVDVVVAVTPPVLSRDICLAAVHAGKPILVEKPLAAAAEDARVMVEAARAAEVPLMTAQTLRFDAAVSALRAKQHLVGRMRRLELTSRIPMRDRSMEHAEGYGRRGALLEIGVHLLDLVRFLTGEEAREVICTMDVLPSTTPDTQAFVEITTDGGIECFLSVDRSEGDRLGTATLIGSEGQLAADWVRQELHWNLARGREEGWRLQPCQTVLATLQSFLDALREKRAMPVTGLDGFRAVEMADACYRSASSGGKPVTLPLAARTES